MRFFIRAVKIRIKTDKRQVILFCCDILVRIVKIKPECRGYFFDPCHIAAAKPKDGNPTITKEIPYKLRKEAGGIFLVQDDPYRMKCEIAYCELIRRGTGKKRPDRTGFSLFKATAQEKYWYREDTRLVPPFQGRVLELIRRRTVLRWESPPAQVRLNFFFFTGVFPLKPAPGAGQKIL